MMRDAVLTLGMAVAVAVAGGGCGGTAVHGGIGGAGGRAGAGPAGAAGAGGGSTGAGGQAGGGSTGSGGVGMGSSCVPGVQGSLIADCGYPSTSSSPLTSVVFSESEVLRAIEPAGGSPVGIVRVFYNDEHALTLGVRQVVVKTASGTTTTDFPVSPLVTDPGSATDPLTGTNELAGDHSGLDASLRPMWPVLFITDITNDPNNRAGDWQHGGVPRSPNAVFGSWKAAVRNVDATVTPSAVSITPDADPAKNAWNLAGGDPVPMGLTSQGYGAEARWSVPIAAGHSYRVQVMVHDGDQNKAGGDSGEACVLFCAGAGGPGGEGGGNGGAGGGGGQPMCPAGVVSCGQTGIDPASCPPGTVCANGCCLSIIP